MSNVEAAVTCFNEGCFRSQAVLATYGPKLGLERDNALKIASTFGGGICLTGETCGAVTGALMVLGLKHDLTDHEAINKSNTRAREFLDKFKARNGSTICRDLLGHDFNTPEGKAYIKEHKLNKQVCHKYVRDAVEIVEDML